MPKAVLTISSKNYGAWALRGWLMAKLAGLEFTEKVIPADDPAMKAEMLLLSSSMLVPSLLHDGIQVWDTLAIGEYLNEIKPKAQLLPADAKARAHCRALVDLAADLLAGQRAVAEFDQQTLRIVQG